VDEWALRDGTACAVCTRTLLAAWVTVGGKLQGVVIVGGNSIDRGLLSDGRTLVLSELNQLHKYAGMLSLCASSDKLSASICFFTALIQVALEKKWDTISQSSHLITELHMDNRNATTSTKTIQYFG